jgi:hypothetical protein
LKLEVDGSLRSGSSFVNPNLQAFLDRPTKVWRELGTEPGRVARITLKLRSSQDEQQLAGPVDGRWTCFIGADDSLSEHFTDWLADHTD